MLFSIVAAPIFTEGCLLSTGTDLLKHRVGMVRFKGEKGVLSPSSFKTDFPVCLLKLPPRVLAFSLFLEKSVAHYLKWRGKVLVGREE